MVNIDAVIGLSDQEKFDAMCRCFNKGSSGVTFGDLWIRAKGRSEFGIEKDGVILLKLPYMEGQKAGDNVISLVFSEENGWKSSIPKNGKECELNAEQTRVLVDKIYQIYQKAINTQEDGIISNLKTYFTNNEKWIYFFHD